MTSPARFVSTFILSAAAATVVISVPLSPRWGVEVRDRSGRVSAVARHLLVVGLQPGQRLAGRPRSLDDGFRCRVPLGPGLEPGGSNGRTSRDDLVADVAHRGGGFVAQPNDEGQFFVRHQRTLAPRPNQ